MLKRHFYQNNASIQRTCAFIWQLCCCFWHHVLFLKWCQWLARRPVCQKQVSRAGTSNYILQILWYVITCPCPWYPLLTQKSSTDKAWRVSLSVIVLISVSTARATRFLTSIFDNFANNGIIMVSNLQHKSECFRYQLCQPKPSVLLQLERIYLTIP